MADLIARSDVFLTNLSMPAIESLEIDAAHVQALNPRIIYVAMPGFGSVGGPYRDYKSWGPNLSALSGLDSLTGDADRAPVLTPTPLIDYVRSEEHTSELQSLMRISYAVFCLKKKL